MIYFVCYILIIILGWKAFASTWNARYWKAKYYYKSDHYKQMGAIIDDIEAKIAIKRGTMSISRIIKWFTGRNK